MAADPPTLFLALPVTKRFQCPLCFEQGILTIRKREGLKRHLNNDHGPGWELSYVCCDIEYSCREFKYAYKKAKAHFEEAHQGTRFEVEDENELGVAAISLNALQDKIRQIATPARPEPPDSPRSASSSSGADSPPSPPPALMRARSAAARARYALGRRRAAADRDLTPPRTPLRPTTPDYPPPPAPASSPPPVLSPSSPEPDPPAPSPPQPSPGPPTPLPRDPSPPAQLLAGHMDVPPPPGPNRSPPGSPPGSPAPGEGEAPDDLPEETTAWQREWLRRFPQNMEWDDFLLALRELTASLAPAERNNRRPWQARGPQPRRNPPRRDHDNREAARLQRLYRTAPSRAMREVLRRSSPFCTIPEATVIQHFRDSYAPRPGCTGETPAGCRLPGAPTPPSLLEPVTPDEVARCLKRTSNTAPGPDGIKYAVWRRRDHSGHVLAAVYNICIAARRFPPAWKESTTVLIHKKGPTEDITNWRPIALSCTAGKLLCSLLAKRLSTWASTHHLISEAQKGFAPTEGCLEHNFVLQELLGEARRRGGEVCIAWLDLANAFGSVPHEALRAALQSAGVTLEELQLIDDLYEGSTTTVRHAAGTTPPINFAAGVRQGCPLSPILFNLVMEFLIRPLLALEGRHGATLHGTSVSVLAYADDLALVAKSEESLRALLDAVIPAAEWVGLRFKPTKCATLHVSRRSTRATQFSIYGEPLRVLGEGDAYQHLGVPTGLRVDQTPVATIARLETEVNDIMDSKLAPWQKLHALRTFLVPQLEFNFNTARIRKTALKVLDSSIKSGCKRILNLPSRASTELVFLPPSSGGAGLIPLSDLADLAAVSHAFRLLTSPDPGVSQLALEGLAVSAGQRSARQAGMDFLVTYLNGDVTGNSNTTTTFSAARTALGRLQKKMPDLRWGYSEARGLQLHVPGPRGSATIDRGARRSLTSSLRASVQHYFRTTLAAKPDQGRVARVVTTCPMANHMLHEGRYTRFADWRFLHRARLNVLPLNGCCHWGANDRRCRRCGRHDETTAHVLCHCHHHLATAITKRHNAILDQLAAAARPGRDVELRKNRRVPLQDLLGREAEEVPEDIARCRPDLVMIDRVNKSIKIVDVTTPYEDGWEAIQAARENKRRAYAPLARFTAARGYTTSVDALVVGALGTWDNYNWGTLARLGINRRHGTTLARRCVSEAIRWSRDIYVTHVTGVQQWPDNLEPPQH